jgi:2-methylcitrate dehydratase PrpD
MCDSERYDYSAHGITYTANALPYKAECPDVVQTVPRHVSSGQRQQEQERKKKRRKEEEVGKIKERNGQRQRQQAFRSWKRRESVQTWKGIRERLWR